VSISLGVQHTESCHSPLNRLLFRCRHRSVERLADEMLVAASRCKVSKSRLWLSTSLFGAKWQEKQLFKKEEDVHEVGQLLSNTTLKRPQNSVA
jgi:hypothetical protein